MGRRAVYLCSVPECTKQVQSRKLCKAHGGGVRCRGPNCTKLAQSRGLCATHGGGSRCSVINCGKFAQYKGLCHAHGGNRRCRVPNCQKLVQIHGYCKAHSKLEGVLSQASCEVSPRDCASHEEFQAYEPSICSADLISHSPPGEYENDGYTRSSRHTNRPFYRSNTVSTIADHTEISKHYASPQIIQVTQTISPRVFIPTPVPTPLLSSKAFTKFSQFLITNRTADNVEPSLSFTVQVLTSLYDSSHPSTV